MIVFVAAMGIHLLMFFFFSFGGGMLANMKDPVQPTWHYFKTGKQQPDDEVTIRNIWPCIKLEDATSYNTNLIHSTSSTHSSTFLFL